MNDEIKKLVEYADQLLDYCMSMQAATGYKPSGSPNLEAIVREVNEIKRRNKNGSK